MATNDPVSDDLWDAIYPLLPPERPRDHGGPPRAPHRAALGGILFILRHGLRGRDLPRELGYGCGVTTPSQPLMPKALRGRVRVAAYDSEQQRVREQLDEARYGPPLLIPVDRIDPNPRNPRRVFNEDALNELAESIKQWKQLQPIVVRRVGERFELICGERRWRAHQRAGLETIWAVEREASDTEAYALALIENMQRVDLSHAEKVAALDQLGELSQEGGLRQTARRLRMSPGWLSVQLSMRKDPVIYPALEAGRVTFGYAAALLRAPAHARRSLLDQTLRSRAGIKEIQNWVREVRRHEQAARVEIGARLALNGSDSARSDALRVLGGILEQLQGLGPPAGREQQARRRHDKSGALASGC